MLVIIIFDNDVRKWSFWYLKLLEDFDVNVVLFFGIYYLEVDDCEVGIFGFWDLYLIG